MTKGLLKVIFSSDFRIERMDITLSDFVELIPRPKEDPSSSPNLDGKTDPKKRANAKRQTSIAKSVPESVVNEFGIPPKAMRALEVRLLRHGSMYIDNLFC